jgi:hypothetical protein
MTNKSRARALANALLTDRRPTRYFHVTIQHTRVVVKYDGTSGGLHTRVIADHGDFLTFLRSKANEAGCDVGDLTVMCSSSLDFPRDEPGISDEVVQLCNQIRGNNVP